MYYKQNKCENFVKILKKIEIFCKNKNMRLILTFFVICTINRTKVDFFQKFGDMCYKQNIWYFFSKIFVICAINRTNVIFSKFFKIFGHFLAIFRVRFSLIFIDKNMRLIFTFFRFFLIFIDFSQKLDFWPKSGIFGPRSQNGPKWVQNGPKMGPKWPKISLIFI